MTMNSQLDYNTNDIKYSSIIKVLYYKILNNFSNYYYIINQ